MNWWKNIWTHWSKEEIRSSCHISLICEHTYEPITFHSWIPVLEPYFALESVYIKVELVWNKWKHNKRHGWSFKCACSETISKRVKIKRGAKTYNLLTLFSWCMPTIVSTLPDVRPQTVPLTENFGSSKDECDRRVQYIRSVIVFNVRAEGTKDFAEGGVPGKPAEPR